MQKIEVQPFDQVNKFGAFWTNKFYGYQVM